MCVCVWHRERLGLGGKHGSMCEAPQKDSKGQNRSIFTTQQLKENQQILYMTTKAVGSSVLAPKLGTVVPTSVQAL